MKFWCGMGESVTNDGDMRLIPTFELAIEVALTCREEGESDGRFEDLAVRYCESGCTDCHE